MTSFAERLISVPQRETGGETGYERYDYQALWGLALVFEHHGSMSDYAIAFEFHDDVVMLDNSTNPTKARFYQVKTKDKGQWTLNGLTIRKKAKNGKDKLPSYIGKLFSNYLAFPQETEQLNFVSNATCDFLKANETNCEFAVCDPSDFNNFVTKLKEECPEADAAKAKLIRYIRADLSLHDSSAHLQGKLHKFVVQEIGSVDYNPDTLYKSIVEECRTRSKHSGNIGSFNDLLKYKGITRAEVENWLDQVRHKQRFPDWAVVSAKLEVSGMDSAELSREWMAYRPLVLDTGNEALNRVRDLIRKEVAPKVGSSETLTQLMSGIYSKIAKSANDIMPLKPSRLKVMILYEVHTYEPPGEVQTTDPQPKDQKQ